MVDNIHSTITRYLKAFKTSNWVEDESYKFEFANYIYKNVNWEKQTNEEIFDFLYNSQKINYTKEFRGVQFVVKGGREKLSEYIKLQDIALFRQMLQKDFDDINWQDRGMSFPILSAWLASLFPEKMFPVATTGFDQVIHYFFPDVNSKLPKQGIPYINTCRKYMSEVYEIIKDYPLEQYCLEIWNKNIKQNPELNITEKTKLETLDWVWIVQDFFLFTHREILGLYKKDEKQIKPVKHDEIKAYEGKTKLGIHIRYERNSKLIEKIKKKRLAQNKMLNCEVCGFSFYEKYGEIGAGFIEAHHIIPLSERKENVKTKESDIALVCSNCHRMLHKEFPAINIEQMKSIIKNNIE